MAQILVVDDDLNTCRSLTTALSKEGHQVFEAHSGEEALEKIRIQEVDLAVIDLMMPGMNGLEFFQSMKALHPEVVAIMISAQTYRRMWRSAPSKAGSMISLPSPLN